MTVAWVHWSPWQHIALARSCLRTTATVPELLSYTDTQYLSCSAALPHSTTRAAQMCTVTQYNTLPLPGVPPGQQCCHSTWATQHSVSNIFWLFKASANWSAGSSFAHLTETVPFDHSNPLPLHVRIEFAFWKPKVSIASYPICSTGEASISHVTKSTVATPEILPREGWRGSDIKYCLGENDDQVSYITVLIISAW